MGVEVDRAIVGEPRGSVNEGCLLPDILIQSDGRRSFGQSVEITWGWHIPVWCPTLRNHL